jgi:hypothetical protein
MGAYGYYGKQREFLCKEDHNETADVTEDDRVKAVRIMATVGENVVSTGKGTTSQPLQTAHQLTRWYIWPILGKLNAEGNNDISNP